MKKLLSLLLVCLVAVVAFAQDEEDEPTGPARTLRYQPKAGVSFLLHTVTTSDQSIKLGSSPQVHRAKVEDERWERWDVIEVNEQGQFTVRATLSRFRQRIFEDDEVTEEVGTGLDGATTTSKDFAQAASGQTYTFRVEPTGEVISVDGLDQIVASIKEKSADAFDEPIRKIFFDQRLKALYGKENVLKTLSYRLKRYPKEPTQAEVRWTQSHKQNLTLGTLTTSERLRIAAKDAPDGSMRLLSEGWFNFANNGREPVFIDLPYAKIEGEDILDPATGFPKVRNTTYEVEIRVDYDRNGPRMRAAELLIKEKEKMEFLAIR